MFEKSGQTPEPSLGRAPKPGTGFAGPPFAAGLADGVGVTALADEVGVTALADGVGATALAGRAGATALAGRAGARNARAATAARPLRVNARASGELPRLDNLLILYSGAVGCERYRRVEAPVRSGRNRLLQPRGSLDTRKCSEATGGYR
ncbi:hypothetical protein ACWDLG_19405 [Nonomuraea sp. NPDC003727]